MIPARRQGGPSLAVLSLVLAMVALILPFNAAPARAESGATVPSGFLDEPVRTGLNYPMAIAYAPNGEFFVAEKRGVIHHYDSPSDQIPNTFADLRTNVHNYWDRGMMGLAVHPNYPASPYVYVLYAYNHIIGDPDPPPRWPASGTSANFDSCPSTMDGGPGATTDGCVISGRLSRLTASGGAMTGAEDVLIEDWCQQFPSHSLGHLAFGPEGALYVSAGEGANFNGVDYGQRGGTQGSPPITPANPCGDPPSGVGTALTPPSAEGGALRSQDLRTSGDPVGLDGTILRIDPATGLGWPTNSLIGSSDVNARRIIGYGLRNPFRFALRPGTSEVWPGDVGFSTWEEIDRITNPAAAPRNFGWPCYEGDGTQSEYQALGLTMCAGLSAGDVTAPYFTYRHANTVAPADGCSTGSSSISGISFVSTTSPYPSHYDGGLFFADYARKCIWLLPAGAGGLPDASAPELFANLNRPGSEPDGGAVFLTTDPSGDLVYADYDRHEIRRIHYYGMATTPPVASFTATPSSGPTPLDVSFDASGSIANGGPLQYDWDLDGDGSFEKVDAGKTIQHTYDADGNVTVGLKVTNAAALLDKTTRLVSVGNSPPSVSINSPSGSLQWEANDTIAFSGSASDTQDGALPASAFEWTLTMRHCPSDCHSHVIESFPDVTSGSFAAPDHELPSHLELSVIVTDSGGLTDTKSVDLFPQTGTVSAVSSPSGIKMTVDGKTSVSPSVTRIVSAVINVSAPTTGVVGEGTWSFQNWSDGGSRSHPVTIAAGTTALTASYSLTSLADVSNSCGGAPSPTVPSGKWKGGTFGSANDVDWFRFKLKKTKRVRFVLGDLSVAGRMELYQGCKTLLKVSDRSGTAAEEMIKNLKPGNYAVRVSGSGTPSTGNYAVLMKKLPKTVSVLSANELVEGSTLRLVGEVYNNTSSTKGAVKVTARLYDSVGNRLATRTAKVDLKFVRSHTRAPFRIVGPLPAGFDHATYTVSAPTTSKRVSSPYRTVKSSGPDGGGHWVVSGKTANTKSTRATWLRFAVTLYDGRGDVLDVDKATVGTKTLNPGQATTFSAWFIPTGLTPDRVYTRGSMIR